MMPAKFFPKVAAVAVKVANHSTRKTCITNLLNENVNPIYVSKLSGHKKLEKLAKLQPSIHEQPKTNVHHFR